jgi:hypothetical protein
MVRVCEDEDKDDDDVKRELQELQDIPNRSRQISSSKRIETPDPRLSNTGAPSRPSESSKPFPKSGQPILAEAKGVLKTDRLEESTVSTAIENEDNTELTKPRPSITDGSCPICSVFNDTTAPTCMVCSNVLKPEFVPNFWRCKSSTCKHQKDSDYINAGDAGACGVCGARKSS